MAGGAIGARTASGALSDLRTEMGLGCPGKELRGWYISLEDSHAIVTSSRPRRSYRRVL
ncbi:hypothetical protein CENSYa_1128 [Cenarchaeum symbiosum A]|uniref:Uncharacterized protein n=1 Tax=Cenarchaeum symbiosum (strain A) TaxID=414004 RepID=A0RWP0_CENSY|nr:hypothetical protein CENSYa_1128 [Cenarchaeum symbiosum A]